LFSKKF